MDLMPVTYYEFKVFFLVLIRVGIFLFMLPFFNARLIPVISKAGLALIISIVLFSVVNVNIAGFPETLPGMTRLVIAELIIGMVLGLMVQIFFEGIKIMGQLVGFQTGFAIVNILDPQSGTQVSILENFAYLVAVTLFLVLNGHHIVLNALRDSFDIINVGSVNLNNQLFQKTIWITGDMFVIAVKIGAPAIAALLLTKAVFGLMTKLMPQMNIMIVAFPLQIVIGLFFFGISLELLLRAMEKYLGGLDYLLINTMTHLQVR